MQKNPDILITVNRKMIFWVVITAISIPILINLALFLSIPPTPIDLSNKDWLSFWGSYFGGCLGGVATLIAVYYTLKHNLHNHEQLLSEQKENKRLHVLPFIDIKGLVPEQKKLPRKM